MVYTQAISLDVARESVLHINAKQYDSGSRNLLVTILESGAEATVPAGSTVTLNARRPDGSAQSFVGSVQDGKVLVGIDSWILEQYGTAYCSITIVDTGTAKITTLSFRLIVERSEGSGWILVYVAGASLAAGSYYITLAGVNYQFTTTSAVPAGGKIYFSSTGTTGKTTDAGGSDIETLTLSVGTTGTQLTGSDVINFLTQMMTQLATNNAAVAAVQAGFNTKADKSGEFNDLTAGTAKAVIDPNSYTPNTSPYLYRQSPNGKRCEYDVIGGTVGWNQNIAINSIRETRVVQGVQFTNNGDGSVTLNGLATGTTNDAGMWSSVAYDTKHIYFCHSLTESITKGTSGVTDHGKFEIVSGQTYNVTLYPYRIDLTALLGSTIADYAYTLESNTSGSGIAWLRSFGFLTKSYYSYTEPTLESVEATARQAVGINQWDEVWEVGGYNSNTGEAVSLTDRIRGKNYIAVFPSTAYYITIPSNASCNIFYYDGNKQYISSSFLYGGAFTTPQNCYFIHMAMQPTYGTTYNGDICINISNSSINGTYYPYESHTYPLGTLTLRGIPKLDANNNIYYDGDIYKADGTVTRNYEVVDLGSKNYTKQSDNLYYCSIADMKASAFAGIVTTLPYTRRTDLYTNWTDADKVYGTRANPNRIYFKDTSYATADAFKTAMSGVYLVYELATPTTETADSFTPIQYTGSTEAFTTSNDVPVGIDGKYYDDLALPKLPTANGTYSLKCTVTDGVGIVSWVSD